MRMCASAAKGLFSHGIHEIEKQPPVVIGTGGRSKMQHILTSG